MTTHCRSENEECSERWMSGSATLTTVMSSSSMKMATDTAINVHHLRSTQTPLGGLVQLADTAAHALAGLAQL